VISLIDSSDSDVSDDSKDDDDVDDDDELTKVVSAALKNEGSLNETTIEEMGAYYKRRRLLEARECATNAKSPKHVPSTVTPIKEAATLSQTLTVGRHVKPAHKPKEHKHLLLHVSSWVRERCESNELLTFDSLKKKFGEMGIENNKCMCKNILRLANKFHKMVEVARKAYKCGPKTKVRFHQQMSWTTLVAVLYCFPEDITGMSSEEMSIRIPGVGDKLNRILHDFGGGACALSNDEFDFAVNKAKGVIDDEKFILYIHSIDIYKYLKKK